MSFRLLTKKILERRIFLCEYFNNMHLTNGRNTSQELFCYGMTVSVLDLNSNILIMLMILNIFISITATIGNLVVLLTIWRSPHLHSPSNTLLFGLALSDLCVGLASEPLNVGFQAVLFNNSSKLTSCTLIKSHPVNCNSNEC